MSPLRSQKGISVRALVPEIWASEKGESKNKNHKIEKLLTDHVLSAKNPFFLTNFCTVLPEIVRP